jgi:hypothetical protein
MSIGAISAPADNILIADQFNNRVIEADPAGNIVWQFGLGPNDFSPKSIIGCNDAQRVGQLTLMAGTGTPPGIIPQATNGAPDNRVILVNPQGAIVWQYGQFGQSGSGSNLLNTPVQCTWLPNSHVLITDQGNARIIEVNLTNQIVWEYPGSNTNAADQLNNPNSAELLQNGNILIADENNSRAIEVTRADLVVKNFTAGGTVSFVAFASRLQNGHTLLTDSGNARAVEVDANDKIVWQYVINTNPPGVLAPLPTRALRLANGDTLISDQFNNRVIRVGPSNHIAASYGLPLTGGTGIGNNVGYDTNTTQKGLYAPYDAKIVGDYTGLTAPLAGNILIADQFNNRVIEADPAGNIVWQFGLGPNDFSPKSIIGCNDAQRVGQLTLMAGTGTPPGVIPQATNGAPDNRVILVNPQGAIVWQYGQFGQTGSGSNLLNTPVQCTWLPNSHVLITDQGNARIIEVNLNNQIVWQYPGSNTNAADQLSNPNSAELLENGHILIADENNNRAIEVTRADQVVKTFTAGGTVSFVAFASRLDNGHTLLTDSGNARAVEVATNDSVVWQYVINTNPPSVLAPLPTRAVRLANGDTLISDQFNNRVIRVSPAGQIVTGYGLPLAGGTGIGNNVGYDTNTTQKGLYAPYDAKIIGDYTGLTTPFEITAISVATNKLTLTWIGGTGPFVVQSKASLADNAWVNAMMVTNRTATLTITNSKGFYRVQGSP